MSDSNNATEGERRQVQLAATTSAAEKHRDAKTALKGKKRKRCKAGAAPPAIRGPPTAVYSIPGFCEAHGISQALYFRLRKLGLSPAVMKVSSRTLISHESAARWRQTMEQRTAKAR